MIVARRLSRALTATTLINAALVLASVISGLAWYWGIVWYPLISLVFVNALTVLLALVVGVWFGASRRLNARLSLGLANGAILVGLICYLGSLHISSDASYQAAVFFAAAFLLAAGYGALGGWLVRRVVNVLHRQP